MLAERASLDLARPAAMHEITSTANPRVKLLRAIASSRGVRRHERALVCGRRIVEELVRRHPDRIESLVYPAGDRALADPALAATTRCRAAPGREFLVLPRAALRRSRSVRRRAAARGRQGRSARRRGIPSANARGSRLFLPLGDPENVGAALRSAAAFSVERVVLLEEAAHPFHPRAIRAAAGACFDLALRSGPSLDALLDAPPAGLDLLVLDRDGEPLDGVASRADRGLLVGEEGRGFAAALDGSQRRVSIPIARAVDSLNGAVAVGIALWELQRRTGER